ncbi:acyl-CoA N-acyltransferase [Epithele typhae]|uniref:acyl-CoA N-acyltransferase n=1 Tax=Epithele typhae TaxID=378194 RepID=UPI0020077FAF|nr:acyl-CoA N-acyltransferase [Epithele typhae]KAH9934005.1 acyl-CoA N-acyltransferase [Epithele typhae]
MVQASHPAPTFAFPIRTLESDRVRLEPFSAGAHAPAFWEGTRAHPALYDFLPWGPFVDPADLLATLVDPAAAAPDRLLFAVLDKSPAPFPPPSPSPSSSSSSPSPSPVSVPYLAGITGYLHADPSSLSVEVGFLVALPASQGRGLMSAAVALLVQYALRLPSDPERGLGLRRVQYQAHTENARSIALAKRLGFVFEGVQRWQRALALGKRGNGKPVREGDPGEGRVGRDSAVLALCWDDWEEGVKEKLCVPGWEMYAA